MPEEYLDIVSEEGHIVGSASRSEVHARGLLHRVVHLLVFDLQGRLLLQKRAPSKDIAPCKWDTSVGGHVELGENIPQALRREMKEELSLENCPVNFLYSYVHRDREENELVYSFRCVYDGPVIPNPHEIEEVRFWSLPEIGRTMDSGIFTENFRDEFTRYLQAAGGDQGV